MLSDDEIRKIAEKYGARFSGAGYGEEFVSDIFSKEYDIFREESLTRTTSRYERLCNLCESILSVKPGEKDSENLIRSIEVAHLNITPNGAVSFGVIFSLLIILIGIFYGFLTYLFGDLQLLLPLMLVICGVILIKPLGKLPNYLASRWRLEASNQMVLCILYVVMYMRHTSNLEHAIKFASEHIGSPLSLDFRKVFWDVEVGKFTNIKDSLDGYLEKWRGYNLEFIEAFHLIEGSLSEPNKSRRIDILEKALNVMLEGTYDKMLHYAHDLKSPITMLHMLGIILPILGLVLFPLLGSFLQGLVKWYHLMFLYNLILPLVVFIIGYNLLSKRPTGYGESNILRTHPSFKQYEYLNFNLFGSQMRISSFFVALIVIGIFFLVGISPLILHAVTPDYDISFMKSNFLGYKCFDARVVEEGGITRDVLISECNKIGGPYGVGAILLGLMIPFGIGIGISLYYKLRVRHLVGIKERTNELEQEFAGSLFQLGNRIGDGLPAEVAFGEVAESMKGTPTGTFFRFVNINLRNLGMGLKEAIFNKDRGAILYFPSSLIESSMKVLIEGARKSPQVVSQSLISISVYVDRIRNVNERLKDLLAEIISSMKSQIVFLTPVIAGIVVSIGSMVVSIISLLGEQFANVSAGGEGLEGLGGIISIVNLQDVIPSYYFQLVVGLYVVEVIIILSILVNGIEKGVDSISEQNSISKNLKIGLIIYTVICIIGVLIFNLLASSVITLTAG